MKDTDIKKLSSADLSSSIGLKKHTLMKLRISNKLSQLENPIQLRFLRKDIARHLTQLRNKELQTK